MGFGTRYAVRLASATWRPFAPQDPMKRTTGATDGPKSLKGFFVGNCLALRRQFTARRLAGCCRVDARFTLASRTLASGRWPLDTGPVGHRLHRHWSLSALVVFGSGRCEKPARSTADNPTADPTNSPDDHQGFLHKVWVTEPVKTRAAAAHEGSQLPSGNAPRIQTMTTLNNGTCGEV